MILMEEPYFMTNPSWYYIDNDDDERGYKLTELAPEEAVESYNDFYGLLDWADGGVALD